MSTAKTSTTARSIVDDVFGRGMTREIWTGNYEKALPVSVQDFDLTAVLPAVFYMFRFGYRRGKGKFHETFGSDAKTTKERRRATTIDRVANKLAGTASFEGFQDETTRAILGDLLLCFCLENTKRALGRQEQVQRVAPAHYMASWVDLPDAVVDLRYVPEMIVAMLADQKGQYVTQNHEGDRTWFAIGRGFEENVLLKAFHQGMMREGPLSGRTADRFREETPVGLDQLLMIRLAQQLGEAPEKLRGSEGERISNQRPIAEQAARHFSEDIRRFVRAYAGVIPRHAFVDLLESCVAVGLTTIITSVIELMFEWATIGGIRKKCEQRPTQLFVDCSNSVHRGLRALAEQSMDDFMRRIERFPVVLMALRLLDYGARYDSKLKKLDIPTWPYATDWLNLLGEILYQRRVEAQAILYDFERKAAELADRLQEDYPETAEELRSDRAQVNPVWRLAEALTSLQGRGNTQIKVIRLVDSVLLTARPNGLAIKRSVLRKLAPGAGTKKHEVRSLVFTDSVLDYFVHLHILRSGNKSGSRQMSLKDFIKILRERYGLYVDQAPPGMTISNELLRLNRLVLERRLRDLGLLVGVNDAEAMKHLMPRFESSEECGNGLD
ncbi:MAG TPA: hypothetical protein DEP53_14480 [Bacteroidetes bacterium]|nr:hypothetical protein [Bacteroidota bacterium]